MSSQDLVQDVEVVVDPGRWWLHATTGWRRFVTHGGFQDRFLLVTELDPPDLLPKLASGYLIDTASGLPVPYVRCTVPAKFRQVIARTEFAWGWMKEDEKTGLAYMHLLYLELAEFRGNDLFALLHLRAEMLIDQMEFLQEHVVGGSVHHPIYKVLDDAFHQALAMYDVKKPWHQQQTALQFGFSAEAT